jgi:hypothetical protein
MSVSVYRHVMERHSQVGVSYNQVIHMGKTGNGVCHYVSYHGVMNTDSQIGRRVGTLMDAKGITQTSMAARMGITQAAISRKLSGERPWFADELAQVAGILEVPVGELFGEHRKPRRVGAGAAAMVPARSRKAAASALVFSG